MNTREDIGDQPQEQSGELWPWGVNTAHVNGFAISNLTWSLGVHRV